MRRWLAILVSLAFVVAVSSALARSDTNTGFTVTSSLDGKTVLPVRSHWIAYPQIDSSQGQVAEVDYLIDGFHAWTAHNSPWYFGDSGNWLVTTILSKVLAIAALAVLSLVVWTQREEVQECADRVRTTLTADGVDDTSCRFLGREVTVPGTLG